MPQITAQLNYLRISPRKVRAVAELLKGLDIDLAQAQLRYLARRPAKPLLKLLNSAVSNAKNNFGLDKDYLYIKEIVVNEGMKLKRYKPKGFSLVMPIQKKTSHIKIVLDELTEEKSKKKKELLAKMPKIEIPVKKPSEALKADGKKEAKIEKPKFGKETEKVSRQGRGSPEAAKKGGFGGIRQFGRKLFRRKVV